MNTQPRALYLLNFVSMWECFSYYGMRALLVLYMIQELHFNDSKAFTIYAAYTTFVELGGVFGGYLADRFCGLKKAVSLGGWTIVAGHLCLATSNSQITFFIALGIIVIGTSLFRTNVGALVGKLYDNDDPRKDAGYTLYYTGINIGGFLAAIFCGLVGEVYGWHAGFGLAAIGMLCGNIAFIYCKNIISYKEEQGGYKDRKWLINSLRAAWMSKRGFKLLILYILFMVLFFGCEEQLGSTLVMFSERHLNRETIFGTIPSASLITFNPLTIILMGPVVYYLMQKTPLMGITKIAISFLFLAGAFFLLNIGCLGRANDSSVPLGYAIGSIFLIGVGELFIGPTVFAAASKAAPPSLAGVTMGLVTLGFSLANVMSGLISQLMAVVEETTSIEIYSGGFYMIGFISLILAVLIFGFNQRQKVES